MVYPNSKSVVEPIIIENNNRHFPVMSSNAAEVPGSLKRGIHGATVTTDVAGAEQMTRTGRRYNQISSSHVEPTFSALEEETSRGEGSHFSFTVTPGTAAEAHTCEGSGMLLEGWVATAQHPGQSEESSARQTSFTKLAVEMGVESEESDARLRADTSIGDRDEVSTEAEFPRSLSPAEDLQRREGGEDLGEVGEVGEKGKVEEVLPDGRLDYPTSTENVQYNDKDMLDDKHPVIGRDVESAVTKGATG